MSYPACSKNHGDNIFKTFQIGEGKKKKQMGEKGKRQKDRISDLTW